MDSDLWAAIGQLQIIIADKYRGRSASTATFGDEAESGGRRLPQDGPAGPGEVTTTTPGGTSFPGTHNSYLRSDVPEDASHPGGPPPIPLVIDSSSAVSLGQMKDQ